MNTTNVTPNELNYSRYTMDKYDKDIVRSIPAHEEIHDKILKYLARHQNTKKLSVLDLGVGTGITSKLIQSILPSSHFDVVDFSKHMLSQARKRLGNTNTTYTLGDYSLYKPSKQYDIIISVIGLHHQNHAGKKIMFKKIYSWLKPGGIFIFADLVTYKDKQVASLNQALHYHHLVEHSSDTKTLAEWAHHHMFLNDLAPIEDQIDWLKECGFQIKHQFSKMNTSLLICKKV